MIRLQDMWQELLGVLAAVLVVWIAVVQVRRHRKLPPRTYASYPRSERWVSSLSSDLSAKGTDVFSGPLQGLGEGIVAGSSSTVQNVLVIGGMGFLGQRLVKRLVETKGNRVHVHVFDTVVPPVEQRHPSITYILGDVRVLGHVEKTLKMAPMDTVFHLAWLPPALGATDETVYNVNVMGTEVVVEAMRSNPHTSRLIYTSSALVTVSKADKSVVDADETRKISTDPVAGYLKTKALAEKAVLTANGEGLVSCVLRPTVVYGRGDRSLADLLLTGKHRLMVKPGDNRVDLVHADDVIEAHLLAFDALKPGSPLAGSVYNIGGCDPISMQAFLGFADPKTGLTHWAHTPPRPIPSWLAHALAFGNALMLDLFNVNLAPAFTQDILPIYERTLTFSSGKAERELGYRPKKNTVETIEEMVADFKAQHAPAAS